jgi:hypothetical protein
MKKPENALDITQKHSMAVIGDKPIHLVKEKNGKYTIIRFKFIKLSMP